MTDLREELKTYPHVDGRKQEEITARVRAAFEQGDTSLVPDVLAIYDSSTLQGLLPLIESLPREVVTPALVAELDREPMGSERWEELAALLSFLPRWRPSWKKYRELYAASSDDPSQAARLVRALGVLITRGIGDDDVPYEEAYAFIAEALDKLLPKVDPEKDEIVLDRLQSALEPRTDEEIFNEDSPTDDPVQWMMMGALAYIEIKLRGPGDVANYVCEYMPSPRPAWLEAVL